MQITYDRDQFDQLLAQSRAARDAGEICGTELAELDEQISTLNLADRPDTRDRGVDLLFSLVGEVMSLGLRWCLDTLPNVQVQVFAQFPGAVDGTADVEYIEFQAYLGADAGLASVGTNTILSLLDTDTTPSAAALLSGVAGMLTRIAASTAAALGVASKSAASAASTHLPVEQRVVSIDGVRAESRENPALTDTEVAALEAATDAQIAAALAANWRQVEDEFFHVHDVLQSAAVRTVADEYESLTRSG